MLVSRQIPHQLPEKLLFLRQLMKQQSKLSRIHSSACLVSLKWQTVFSRLLVFGTDGGTGCCPIKTCNCHVLITALNSLYPCSQTSIMVLHLRISNICKTCINQYMVRKINRYNYSVLLTKCMVGTPNRCSGKRFIRLSVC